MKETLTKIILLFAGLTMALFAKGAIDGAVCDQLVRDYITPQRIVWQQGDSILKDAEALLLTGDGQVTMGRARFCQITNKKQTSLILDFGRELHGGLRILTGTGSKITTHMRIRFGESVGETCSETVENSSGVHGYSTNDHTQRNILTSVSRYGSIEIGNTGFRFVRIDILEPDARVNLKEVRAIARYRDLPYVGSFKCSDHLLDSIWQTAFIPYTSTCRRTYGMALSATVAYGSVTCTRRCRP